MGSRTCHRVHDKLHCQLASTHRQQVGKLPLAVVGKSDIRSFNEMNVFVTGQV